MQGVAERTRTAGWLPKQHGAWAMLVVPFAVGAVLSWGEDRLASHVAPMFATWILGYFAFYAASGLLKSPPTRRRRWAPALLAYGFAALAAGLVTLAEAGWECAWWLAGFVPVLAVALWLAARRDERSLAGGLLTVLATCAMLLVVRFPDPLALRTDPDAPHALTLAALLFGYFAGTVFHVKAMIRRRGEIAWRNLSIGWHTAWTLLAAGLVVIGRLDRVWPAFFLVTTVRAWLLPTLAGSRRIRPAVTGGVEILLSLAVLGIAWWTLAA